MYLSLPSFLITTLLLSRTSNALRSIPEYQVAILKVVSSFLSPANKQQADSINSTLLADNIVIRGKHLPGSTLALVPGDQIFVEAIHVAYRNTYSRFFTFSGRDRRLHWS